MVIQNLKEDILKNLNTSYLGKSIKRIAEELELSRTTVSKYLKELLHENKVYFRDLGVYKVWISREMEESFEKNPYRLLVIQYYSILLKSLQEIYNVEILDKAHNIGVKISKDLDIERFMDLDIIYKTMQNEKIKIDNATSMKALVDILKTANIIGDRFDIDPPLIDGNIGYIRIKNSLLINSPMHFHIVSGVLEGKINSKSIRKLNIKIHKIDQKNKYVDFKIEFQL